MSDDAVSREDQAHIERLMQGAMQKLAAGRPAEDVSRELQATGLAQSTCDALVEHLQQQWREIAAAPQANAEVYYRTKFPEMRPVRSAPWLFWIHGVGAGLYNERDRDSATGSVVKTHCVSLMFFPIFALGAYRVLPRGSGYAMIGKVPLSRFAMWWNIVFLMAIVAFIGFGIWDDAQNSPDAAAARALARADRTAARGHLLTAARMYRDVSRTHTEHAIAAREHCLDLLDRPEIEKMPMRDVVQVFRLAISMPLTDEQMQAVQRRGMDVARQRMNDDPIAAAELVGRLTMVPRPN